MSNWDLFVCFVFAVGCFVDVIKMEGSSESVLCVLSRTGVFLIGKKKLKEKIVDILFTLFPMFLGIPFFKLHKQTIPY